MTCVSDASAIGRATAHLYECFSTDSDDLWRRPDLTPRDRSLVTASRRSQIAEAFTHVGFYAGWGRAIRAMTLVAKTLTK